MRFRFNARAIGYLVGLPLVLISLIATQVWAGLHFTDEEIAIWRVRKDSGPYKDEWNAILTKATAWKNNPGPRFTGWTSDTCYTGSMIPDNRSFDDGLTEAAFVYLITGSTSYRDAVRKALLQQVSVSGTNFANTRRWCPTIATLNGYGDNLTTWMRKLVYGYSYIRGSLSATDKNTLDTWFLNAGKHFDTVLHNIVKKRFPNRYNDNYSCSYPCPGDSIGSTHYKGYTTYRFGEAWMNKGTSINAAIAAIGVLVNNITLIDHSKRYVTEWIKFATYPGGQVFDQFRWGGVYTSSTTSPQHGYLYSGLSIGSIVSAVDHIARFGDTSLYEFETSEGMFGTQGGPKSLKRILQHFAGMAKGTIIEYASTSATSNSGLIIDRENEPQFGQTRVEHVNIAPANVYYKDNVIASAYQLPIPASFDTVGCNTLKGEWCTYPRIRFMFGQMEGKIWPYSGTGTTSLTSPTNLRIVPENP
jgi:hypothetical protein